MDVEGIINLFIALSALLIVFYAYRNNAKGPLYISLAIVTSMLLRLALSSFATVIADISFLDFLRQIALGFSGLVVYVELAIIVFIAFLSGYKFKKDLLKIAAAVYVVLTLLVEFNVF